ncbi:hypothetical protein LTR67_001061 [Exophiala xenobiotica]
MRHSRPAVAVLIAILAFLVAIVARRDWPSRAEEFDPAKVVAQAFKTTSRSWEFGALTRALLEYENPNLTVFSLEPFPGGRIPEISHPADVEALRYAKSVIWTNHSDLLIDGEGSPSDPASLGTAALLLSAHDNAYFEAARRQAEYLLQRATRFHINETASAISHRDEPPELWGDFIYMVPPFLAYYGVATQDLRFLKEAVHQCQLYNDVLRTDVSLETGDICRGLWRHIVSDPMILPTATCCSDPDVWLTSNAWAVAGMTQVLATIVKWQPPLDGGVARSDYARFAGVAKGALVEIITAMLTCVVRQARDPESSLVKNYLDGPLARSAEYAFGDTAGTALMSAAVYRLAVLEPTTFARPDLLDWADINWHVVSKHIDNKGIVGPVADVSNVPSKVPVQQTSEGQSMVLLMYSARQDCVRAGLCNRRSLLAEIRARMGSLWQG